MIESEVATLTLCNNNFSDDGTWTVFHGHPLRVCAFHSGQKVFFFFKPHEGVCGALITVVRAQCHGLGPVLDCVAFGEAYKLVMFCGDSGF